MDKLPPRRKQNAWSPLTTVPAELLTPGTSKPSERTVRVPVPKPDSRQKDGREAQRSARKSRPNVLMTGLSFLFRLLIIVFSCALCVAALLCLCWLCAELSDRVSSSTDTSKQYVTPSLPHDPVASLKQIAGQISPDRTFHTTQEDWINWASASGVSLKAQEMSAEDIQNDTAKLYRYSYNTLNVEKTASLVSPYTGEIYFSRYEQTSSVPDEADNHYRVLFAYQDDSWVARNVERKAGENSWQALWKDSPQTDLIKRLFKPYVEWDLVNTN